MTFFNFHHCPDKRAALLKTHTGFPRDSEILYSTGSSKWLRLDLRVYSNFFNNLRALRVTVSFYPFFSPPSKLLSSRSFCFFAGNFGFLIYSPKSNRSSLQFHKFLPIMHLVEYSLVAKNQGTGSKSHSCKLSSNSNSFVRDKNKRRKIFKY